MLLDSLIKKQQNKQHQSMWLYEKQAQMDKSDYSFLESYQFVVQRNCDDMNSSDFFLENQAYTITIQYMSNGLRTS